MDSTEVERLRARAVLEATRQHAADELYEEVVYYGMEEAMQGAIAQTIARLPREVQAFACSKLRFVSIGPDWRGLTWPAQLLSGPAWSSPDAPTEDIAAFPTDKYWVILLHDSILADAAQEDTQSTIAHEIAHAGLGHDCRPGLSRGSDVTGEANECAAAQQAQAWGLTGHAACPEDYVI